jgi:hypothetical protein
MGSTSTSKLLLADGVWIATALLHRENPDRSDFSEGEIQARFLMEGFPRGAHSNSLPAHIGSHCVANKPRSRKKDQPSKLQGGAYRILYETRPGFRRLFHSGDDVHPDRIQPRRPSKTAPNREEIPSEYQPLLDWYSDWKPKKSNQEAHASWENDPLVRLIGSGCHIWADEHADEYVENLRREDR